MHYSISQVAEKMNLAPHTIRYYEKEGILSIHRTEKGIRYFTDSDLEDLSMICCLKSTGMPIKEIKKYFDLCSQGPETFEERMGIFTSHQAHILEELETLQKHLSKINQKINWYKGYVESKKEA